MLDLRGNNNGTLSSYISPPPKHIDLWSGGHQPNKQRMPKHRKDKQNRLPQASWILGHSLPLFKISSWLGKPFRHLLITSKAPLQPAAVELSEGPLHLKKEESS